MLAPKGLVMCFSLRGGGYLVFGLGLAQQLKREMSGSSGALVPGGGRLGRLGVHVGVGLHT